jgi:uncharacterized membrane protein
VRRIGVGDLWAALREGAADVAATRDDILFIGLIYPLAGLGVGFLFAVLAFALSVVSFPVLLDRDVGVTTAIATSLRAVRENLGVMVVWGLIVAGALVLGSLPALVGLIFVVPLLGHATWRLYRRLVE